jgi:hypothetical protein
MLVSTVTIALQKGNDVYYAVRAEMLYAGPGWSSVVVNCCCEKLVREPKGERPPLGVATKQRLVKAVTMNKT